MKLKKAWVSNRVPARVYFPENKVIIDHDGKVLAIWRDMVTWTASGSQLQGNRTVCVESVIENTLLLYKEMKR